MSEEKKWVLGLKRAISFIICLIILFTYPTKLMAAQEPPEEAELFAKAAVLMDGGSGRILYSKKQTVKRNKKTTYIPKDMVYFFTNTVNSRTLWEVDDENRRKKSRF